MRNLLTAAALLDRISVQLRHSLGKPGAEWWYSQHEAVSRPCVPGKMAPTPLSSAPLTPTCQETIEGPVLEEIPYFVYTVNNIIKEPPHKITRILLCMRWISSKKHGVRSAQPHLNCKNITTYVPPCRTLRQIYRTIKLWYHISDIAGTHGRSNRWV